MTAAEMRIMSLVDEKVVNAVLNGTNSVDKDNGGIDIVLGQ